MSAATLQVNTLGRGPNVLCDVAVVSVTITGVSTTYATASGGLPFDLTGVLQTISPSIIPSTAAPLDSDGYMQTINPADLVGVIPNQMSTNKFLPLNFVVGTPTYDPPPWQYDNGVAATPGYLKTCPCTIRLWGTGASNAAAFAEVADGANSDVLTVLLQINRNGANN